MTAFTHTEPNINFAGNREATRALHDSRRHKQRIADIATFALQALDNEAFLQLVEKENRRREIYPHAV